jgi:hypothetical protein
MLSQCLVMTSVPLKSPIQIPEFQHGPHEHTFWVRLSAEWAAIYPSISAGYSTVRSLLHKSLTGARCGVVSQTWLALNLFKFIP